MASNPRTHRLLEARLEELACVGERTPVAARAVAARAETVSAATRRAVELELLSVEEAQEIWATVAGRHPEAAWCRADPVAA